MANKKDIKREQLLDQCERLYVMGFRKPYHIMKALPEVTDIRTAENYLSIAARRVFRRNLNIDKNVLLKNQLTTLDLMITELWQAYINAKNSNERVGAINSLTKTLKQKAELLGLEAPKEIKVGGDRGDNLLELLQRLPEENARQIIDQLNSVQQGGDTKGDV